MEHPSDPTFCEYPHVLHLFPLPKVEDIDDNPPEFVDDILYGGMSVDDGQQWYVKASEFNSFQTFIAIFVGQSRLR